MTHVEGISDELRDVDALDDPDEITQVRKRKRIVAGREIPKGVEVYAVNGPFFFGAADKLNETMSEIAKPPRAFILRMHHVPAIDATGIHTLEQIAKKCRGQGTMMILSEVRAQPFSALAKASKLEIFGAISRTFDLALARAAEAAGVAAARPSDGGMSSDADQGEERKQATRD